MARRNVALNATDIAAAVTFLATQAIAFGVIPQAAGDAVLSQTPGLVAAAGVVIAAVHLIVGGFIHPKVTPVADPKDNAGNVLIPVTVAARAVVAASGNSLSPAFDVLGTSIQDAPEISPEASPADAVAPSTDTAAA